MFGQRVSLKLLRGDVVVTKPEGLTQTRTRTGLREPKPVPAGFTKARSDWPLQGLQGLQGLPSLHYGNSTSHP